ncbi:MAG: TonB-dependent hemoglobin/transferrin/lactoferrin family receptor [Candidatus Devosia phytovorans]|uniref:TonB-dependent hemoglobin/transferrin/lactoferrin family receptor n=1 Tax=Candidatus Devosia phytovorans TaxID=3121372 RepID=A0AAJ5VUK5_9HYPH|nr:TonB-dependent hemoglobin/transferrin/lactoferrin family receptor [Devosia sp.]WEK04411.1 MAG: TonB-dependent hemoglobin/transferrin/lactoferrin family receptor [Devosia sp.]
MERHRLPVADAARHPLRLSARAILLGATVLAGFGLPGVVQGQEATQLSNTQVTLLERLVISSTRNSKRVLDVPATVTVISSDDIETHVVRDMQDLVRYEPGIAVDRQTSITNPWGQLNSFTIRGMGGNRVLMMVDGSRIQERITDGSRDFIDTWNLQAVELVRGPNSVLWGADALGGTVAMRTRDPADLLDGSEKPWAVEIRTAFDSYDNSWRKQITGAYDFGAVQVLGSFGHLSSTEREATNGDPDGGPWGLCPRPSYFRCNELFPADTSAYNGLVKVVATPSDDHEITLTGEFFDRNTVIEQIWDSSAALGGYTSNAYPRELDMERYRLAVEHDWQVDAPWLDSVNWQLSVSPQRRVTESTSYRTYAARTQTVYQLRDYGETFYEADLQLTSSFEAGPTFHTLTYGFDGDFTRTNYEGRNETWRSDTNVTTIVDNQGFSFPKSETVRADLYIQDEIKAFDDRLTITPGVRWANYQITPDSAYASLAGYSPEEISSSELIKKLSLQYQLTDEYSVYAAYGEGFKMPSSQQLFQSNTSSVAALNDTEIVPNLGLKPESVKNYEVGLRGEFEQGWFSVSGFYSKYSNFIRSLQPTPTATYNAGTGVWSQYWSDNVENVELYGVEIGGEYEFYENIFATANVSWQRGTQQVNSTAATTPFDGAVPLTAVLGLRYEMPEHGLEFELLTTLASGVTERADPAAFKPDGYALVDGYATWKPNENVEINFGVQNIFDTKYYPNTLTGYAETASSSVAGVNPLEAQVGAGRTFKVGTTVKF